MMRTLFSTLACIVCTSFGQALICSRGPHNIARFGPSCEYMCHCSGHQCEINTGDCPDNIECDPGWMGSGCQYVNIAYNAKVQSNLWDNGQNIVDGNSSTCANYTNPNGKATFLNLDFGQIVKITDVHLIVFNTVPSFNVIISSLRDTSRCSLLLKKTEPEIYIVTCGSPIFGNILNITLQGPNSNSTLCEIQIPAGRNLAYGKTANQSSTFQNYTANLAVDGTFTSGSSSQASGTCTHTTVSEAPWWILDLETSDIIQWFRIYNRPNEIGVSDDLQDRLKYFRIFRSEDNVNFSEVYQDQSNQLALSIETHLTSNSTVRFVKIDLNGTNRILTLCEVQIFGECNDAYYGNCTSMCGHCRFPAICDKITGFCPSGLCSDGWHGEKCDTECNLTYYGQNCESKCGHCLNGTCDRFTGNCSKDAGCQLGWQGSRCDIECNVTHYGQNCASKCGYCLNGTCDRFTGSCHDDHGCQLGWNGSRCDIACDNAYYGNCTTRCGNCRDSAICDKVNGACPLSLCTEGWYGEKCDTTCDSKYYGQNCAYECGRCINGTCDRITGNCFETSGCQPGWYGSRCDLVIGPADNQGSNNSIEPSILGGSIGGAVAMIGFIIAMVIIIILKRRNMDTTTKETNTNKMELISDYINMAAGNEDIPAQQTAETNLDNSKTYYNIEESSAEITLNTNAGIRPSNYYEKLGDRTVAEESSYSTIQHSYMDTHGRKSSEITIDCDEQLTSLDIELRNVEEKKRDLLKRKEKLIRQKLNKS